MKLLNEEKICYTKHAKSSSHQEKFSNYKKMGFVCEFIILPIKVLESTLPVISPANSTRFWV